MNVYSIPLPYRSKSGAKYNSPELSNHIPLFKKNRIESFFSFHDPMKYCLNNTCLKKSFRNNRQFLDHTILSSLKDDDSQEKYELNMKNNNNLERFNFMCNMKYSSNCPPNTSLPFEKKPNTESPKCWKKISRKIYFPSPVRKICKRKHFTLYDRQMNHDEFSQTSLVSIGIILNSEDSPNKLLKRERIRNILNTEIEKKNYEIKAKYFLSHPLFNCLKRTNKKVLRIILPFINQFKKWRNNSQRPIANFLN